MGKYAKALVAAGVLVGAVANALTDGTITGPEWVTIGTAAAGVAGVWGVRNKIIT